MANELFIRMPYLHPALNKAAENQANARFENIKYFWPGHAALEKCAPWWQAENLPLSVEEAAAILASLQNHDLRDLERIRLLMQQGAHKEERRFRSEMRDLERFLGSPESPPEKSAAEAPLKQAQINLLWLWLQEEEYLELDSLARHCSKAETQLLNAVHEFADPSSSAGFSMLQTAKELLPDWKNVFLNAAFFIDADIPILLEGSMRDDLLSEFAFENINEAHPDLSLKKAELPLWKILGRKKSEQDSLFMENVWNKARALYAWSWK